MNEAGADRRFQLGDWCADPAANELLHANGRRARLEARAMKVLALLHERAGAVVSIEEILDRIWGRTAVSPHSVAIVISDLRKALGDDARAPRYIETIPKQGYRLLPGAREPRRRRGLPTAIAGVLLIGLTVAVFGLRGGSSTSGTPAAVIDRPLETRYFQARQLWSRRDHAGILEARRLLEQIIAERDDFAAAHAALADIYAHKTGEHLALPALDTFRAAQRHLDRAMALDARQAEPYVTQALLHFYRDHQPGKALAALDIAQALDPQLAYAWQTRAMVLSAIGRHTESLAAIERARQLDPVSDSIGWDRVWFLHLAGRQEQALAALEEAGSYSRPNLLYHALIEQARGQQHRALELWLERFAQKGIALPDAERIRGATSLPEAYRELLAQLATLVEYREYPGVVAIWQLLAQDENVALATLAAAPPDRDNWLQIWLHELPVFEPLRGHPRMRALVSRTGIGSEP